MSSHEVEVKRRRYAEWLAQNENEREAAGIPTKAEFSRSFDVNRRTLGRWEKDDPEFQALFNEAVAKRTLAADDPDDPRPAALTEGSQSDGVTLEGLFAESLESLQIQVRKGNVQALKLLYDKLGKHLVDAEHRRFESDFRGHSDSELVEAILALVPAVNLAHWLRSLGWRVSPPESGEGSVAEATAGDVALFGGDSGSADLEERIELGKRHESLSEALGEAEATEESGEAVSGSEPSAGDVSQAVLDDAGVPDAAPAAEPVRLPDGTLAVALDDDEDEEELA